MITKRTSDKNGDKICQTKLNDADFLQILSSEPDFSWRHGTMGRKKLLSQGKFARDTLSIFVVIFSTFEFLFFEKERGHALFYINYKD